jgi:hypothetical protein
MNMAIQPPLGDDAQTEQMIQRAGKTAPRVILSDIETAIASEHYFTAQAGATAKGSCNYYTPDHEVPISFENLGLLTFCVLVLRNGFTVTGESACVSVSNFDPEIGRKISRQNAIQKIWPLLGYSLKEKLASSAI